MPPEKVLIRTAERVVAGLLKADLLTPRETPAEIQKRVLEAIKKNFQEELAIDRETERILEENRRQMVGMDQRTLFGKIREKVARERGFVL